MKEIEDAKKTWEVFDSDLGRRVAWSSINEVSKNQIKNFSEGLTVDAYVRKVFKEKNIDDIAGKKEIIGAAIACGDLVSERIYFEEDKNSYFSLVECYDIYINKALENNDYAFKCKAIILDCNRINLDENKYSFIIGSHGIHHIYNLGNIFYQVNKALKDTGLLFLNEWVGPEYLQFPFMNKLIAQIILFLFYSKKQRTTHMGIVKGKWMQQKPNEFEPSEACNSSEIIPQLKKYFNPIKEYYYGGLMYPIYEGMAQNIDQTKSSEQFKIKFVIKLEEVLTKLRIIKPLFLLGLYEKKFR